MSDSPCILVVDDTPANLELLVDLLEVRGYRTLSAATGGEALAALERESVDLVLLDVILPDMDGYEVCRRIRARSATEALPVLLVTAVEPGRERIIGLEAGADDFLSKPIDRQELLARVRSLLRIRTLYRQLAEAHAQTLASEKELRWINRTLRMLSLCNETLVHASGESDLLQAICRQIVDIGGYGLAWVGFVLQDGSKVVQPAAYAGDDENRLAQPHSLWAKEQHGIGAAAISIREGRPTVVRNFPRPSDAQPGEDERRDTGFAASIALPLYGQGVVIGALNICSAEADAFDADEVRLLQELASDLAYGLHSLRETEARKHFERVVEYQANYDTLTGLPNRNLFLDRVRHILVQCARSGRLAAVLVIDLDRFKRVNDSLGHAVGDQLLKHVGQRFCACLRAGDTVARFSADEFAVVMSDVAREEDVALVAGKLLAAAAQPFALGGSDLPGSASIGIRLHPRDGEAAEILVKNAETAMYNAKALGGNAFCFYALGMNEHLAARLALEADLRRAITQGELVLHFQPRINLRSGNVVGAEALVRWQHPERGMIPPGDFIPLAEENGLILPLGEWVLDATCRQIRLWLDQGLPVPVVAVNLSSRQFRQENLARSIQAALGAHRLQANCLELEITESTAMHDLEVACRTLRELKGIGLKLSLDDFGTGYSSLAYLKRFPIDHLKIDRSFVRDITTDPDDAAICIAVIGLAHSLKLSVIAEGVETEGQMNYLRRHGCDDIQGYYFSRPLPAEEFSRFLAGWCSPPLGDDDERQTVLIVDDEPNVASALKRSLRREGYRIFTAAGALDGFDILATQKVQVILSDQRMPSMNGTDFLARVRDLYPDTIRIVLSGYTELSSITDAINHGAIYKFLTKPWDDDQLREQVREAFRYYQAGVSRRVTRQENYSLTGPDHGS